MEFFNLSIKIKDTQYFEFFIEKFQNGLSVENLTDILKNIIRSNRTNALLKYIIESEIFEKMRVVELKTSDPII